MLRPDALIVCGKEPDRHVHATPALVVEVLSESTRERDLTYKRKIYQEQAVPYYFILNPEKNELIALELNQAGEFVEMEQSQMLRFIICEDCELEIPVKNW